MMIMMIMVKIMMMIMVMVVMVIMFMVKGNNSRFEEEANSGFCCFGGPDVKRVKVIKKFTILIQHTFIIIIILSR